MEFRLRLRAHAESVARRRTAAALAETVAGQRSGKKRPADPPEGAATCDLWWRPPESRHHVSRVEATPSRSALQCLQIGHVFAERCGQIDLVFLFLPQNLTQVLGN